MVIKLNRDDDLMVVALRQILIYFLAVTIAGCLLLPILYAYRAPIISAYNFTRPFLLDGGGEKCIAELSAKNVTYKKLGDIGTNECPISNAVRITGFQNTEISSPFILSCSTANIVATWLDDIKASSIKHMGTLNCRKRRGGSIYSEHSFGTAIDISHIDGASVKNDWGENDDNGKTLAKATTAACKYFSNVLTPDSNRLHHDHYHLDTGIGLGCSLGRVTKRILKVVRATNSYFN